MDKLLKVVIGWIVIILIGYLFLMIAAAFIPGGDGIWQTIIAGVFLLAFMLWLFKVDIDEKFDRLLEQKEK